MSILILLEKNKFSYLRISSNSSYQTNEHMGIWTFPLIAKDRTHLHSKSHVPVLPKNFNLGLLYCLF